MGYRDWSGNRPTAKGLQSTIEELCSTLDKEPDTLSVSSSGLDLFRESEEDGGNLVLRVGSFVVEVDRALSEDDALMTAVRVMRPCDEPWPDEEE